MTEEDTLLLKQFPLLRKERIQLVLHTPRNNDPYIGHDGETISTRLVNSSA